LQKRSCPYCGGSSFSSYSGPNWDCPYCGKDLSNVPDEFSVAPDVSLEQETPLVKLYSIKGGKN